MKRTLLPMFLITSALTVAGCAQSPSSASRGASPAAGTAVVTQVGYGRAAQFVTCTDANCGRPTPKTLAGAPEVESPLGAAQVSAVMPQNAPPSEPAQAVPVAPAASVAAPAIAAATTVTTTEQRTAPAPAPAATREDIVPTPRPIAKVATVDPEFVQAEASNGRQRIFIGFPSGSARLTNEAKAKLSEVAPQVHSAQHVVIKGRTDERGTADSNDRLALRRALAVYDYLRRSAKANKTPFKLLAKGACCYIARNITEDGRAANRRAEIDFVTPMQAAARPAQPSPGKGKPS